MSDITKQCTADERPNSNFTIVNPKNNKEYPVNKSRVWGITKDTFHEYYKRNKILFPGDYSNINIKKPALRIFKWEDELKYGESPTASVSTHLPVDIGMSQDGAKVIIDIFGSKVFPYPKPVSLIKYLISIANTNNITILDFFAGSGTTAHATMELNSEDNGNRQCILVTNNEIDKKTEKNLLNQGIEKILLNTNHMVYANP